jgi:glycosyltransferase involved in cell wall biosynthesis
MFSLISYDYIFIHREITPIGPPFFEWLIAKVFRKKIIYDFDDAIWTTDRVDESWLLRSLKWRNKVKFICKNSDKVSCGNEYLAAFAKQFNTHVIYNPTTIDTSHLHNLEFIKKRNKSLTIGWTGSHSTLKYLRDLEPVLQQIEIQFPHVQFAVIADQPIALKLKSLQFIPWSIKSEINDLYQIDIGVMPLPDDEWSKGKCGFKALQFMALQIPVVASPIGVNVKIIDHGVDGFLASTQHEWIHFLTQLIEDNQLQMTIGANGREKVLNGYSVNSNVQNFLSLF